MSTTLLSEPICSESIEAGMNNAQDARKKVLVLGTVSDDQLKGYVARMREYDVTLLLAPESRLTGDTARALAHRNASGRQTGAFDAVNIMKEELDWLKSECFDAVVVPYDDRMAWGKGWLPERLAAAVAPRVVILFEDGGMRAYEGEDLNRIQYNRAYIDSMFRFVPPLKGKRVLEIGCSDGLACDLLLTEGPESVTGIDVCEEPGARFNDPRLHFSKMDATRLEFPDKHFDLCYSIAVMEHCPDPLSALKEMKRVTRPGGYCYVQAGPLYFSPFGHHMFGYFDKYPWIHLRLTPEEIIYGATADGIAARLKAETGRDIEEYVGAMLNPAHVNGLALSEYGLKEFAATDEIEVLNFTISHEGENLFNEGILTQLADIGRQNLITHGFELIFRVL